MFMRSRRATSTCKIWLPRSGFAPSVGRGNIDPVGGGERTSGSVISDQRGHVTSVTRKGPRRKWFFRSLCFCDNLLPRADAISNSLRNAAEVRSFS